MKICPICRNENRSEAAFCRICGGGFQDAEETMFLSDPATSEPLEAETTLFLPPAFETVPINESSSSSTSISAETEADETEMEVKTGPLLPLPVFIPPSENKTSEDSTKNDVEPTLLPVTEEVTPEDEPDTVNKQVIQQEIADISQSSAVATMKLPSLEVESKIEIEAAPATTKLSTDSEITEVTEVTEATEFTEITEFIEPQTANNTLLPDEAKEKTEEIEAPPDDKNQGKGDESRQNDKNSQNNQKNDDETAPIPMVVAAPTTGKLAPILPEPLSAGDMVAERYKIIEWLKAEEEANVYSAEDLYACEVCQFAENPADEQFCWDCGVDRTEAAPALCELREGHVSDAAEQGNLPAGFIYNDLFYLPILKEVKHQPDSLFDTLPEPISDPTRRTNRTFSVGYASHVGMIRRLNEDSLSVFTLAGVYESISNPSLGLFIVADGLGGHDGGEFASKYVVETISDRLIRRVLLPKFNGQPLHEDAIMPRVKEAILYANEQLYNLAVERQNDMGCTLTMALVIGQEAYIANVGDSRTYIFRESELRQITEDHSLIASLISAGIAQPEEIYTHPERNVIYRSMGHAAEVEADLWEEKIEVGDQMLLCSDGLWETIHDEGIIEVLSTHSDVQTACDQMIHRGNLAGGEDNITVVLVKLD